MKGLKNNTLGVVWEWFIELISPGFNAMEARAVGRLIFEHYLNTSTADFFINRDIRINESDIVLLHNAAMQLNKSIPVQYITGQAFFRDLVLEVNSDVLIPRNETEELVQWILDDEAILKNGKTGKISFWDIGTGSGAIAISLAKELNYAQVTASDFSEKILETARKNAMLNNVNIDFFVHDILKTPLLEKQFDCIVSNPPYVRESEKAAMMSNVLDYEPHHALFVSDDDPLVFYRSLAETSKKCLVDGGWLYTEINEALGKETASLFEKHGFSQVEINRDIHEKERFVRGRL